MATAPTGTVIGQLRRIILRHDTVGKTDGQLLSCFIDAKDEMAFAELVHRHGPMVLGVCRRVLGNHHDAEDAFQATFLILVRKASFVRARERVANWLHGVALRTAMKAKTMTAKRQVREKQVADLSEPEAAHQNEWHDQLHVLDQELNGLPENYRLPILLCDLRGKTIKEAAQEVGWPQGTVAGRLARGRKLLAKRLASRGVVLTAGALAMLFSEKAVSGSVPIALMNSTIKAAAFIAAGRATVAGVVPAKVAVLTEEALKAMFMTKLKSLMSVTMVMLAFIVGVGGVGLLGHGNAVGQQEGGNKSDVVAPNKKVAKSDKDRLQGKWLLISCECNGEDQMQPWLKDNALLVIDEADGKLFCKTVFKDRARVFELFGEEMDKWTKTLLKLDARTKPKTLDSTDGKGTYLGIYKLDGDTLTWCQSEKGLPPGAAETERPTEFSTTPGDGRSLVVYKRQKENAETDTPKDQAVKDKPAMTDLDRLQGVWSVVSTEQNGKPAKLEKTVFMVDGKRACLRTCDGELQGGLYLDPASTPKTYDFVMSERTIEGIYSLDGDTLRLCYDPATGAKRPVGFVTEKDKGQFLFVLKRVEGAKAFGFLPDGTKVPFGQEGEAPPVEKKGKAPPLPPAPKDEAVKDETARPTASNPEAAQVDNGDNPWYIKSKRDRDGYKAVFIKSLAAMAQHFEDISHANLFEGRIEAGSCSPVTREGFLDILPCDDDGFLIVVRINKVVKVGTKSVRDAELERTILKQLNAQQDPKKKLPALRGSAPSTSPVPKAAPKDIVSTPRKVADGTAKVGHIIIVGNTKTEDGAIRKILRLHPGDVINYEALRIAQKNLAALKARIDLIESVDNVDYRDIRVTVVEK
jgi:RNA polymerase sigma factor (sigma-70 family)